MSRYRLTIHPDDVQRWKATTDRDQWMARPVSSDAALDYLLETAERHGVRVLAIDEADEADR